MTAETARELAAAYKAGQLRRVLNKISSYAKSGATRCSAPDGEVLTEETVSLLKGRGFEVIFFEQGGFHTIDWEGEPYK